MTKSTPSLAASLETLMAQMTEMRAEMARQREIASQQQMALSALEDEMRLLQAMGAASKATMRTAPDVMNEVDQADAPVTSSGAQSGGSGQRGKGTSRRGLLRGAAVGAAAAAVAAVGVGDAEQAHAAPNATGGSFILGQANDANVTTSLTNTTGSAFTTILSVVNAQNFRDALYAEATDASAVSAFGYGSSGYGVYGYSDSGTGVAGSSDTGVALSAGGAGTIFQATQMQVGNPSGTHYAGESIRDASGELWLCTASGTPGTWVRVAHALAGLTGGAITYLSKPIRLLDTRGSDSLAKQDGGGPIAGGTPTGSAFPVTIAGVTWQSVSVPPTSVGAIGNVTAIGGAAGGFLAIVPHGAGYTGTATLAYGANQVVSNAFNTALSGGQLDILIGGGAADVILDLIAVIA